MIPKIDLSGYSKDEIPKKEVMEMLDALSNSFITIMQTKERDYKFAKIVSYISLAIALCLVFLEVIGQ